MKSREDELKQQILTKIEEKESILNKIEKAERKKEIVTTEVQERIQQPEQNAKPKQ